MTIIENIPANLDTSFLKETESTIEPVIRREGSALIFPALVRKNGDIYHYFDIPCAYTGQDMSDYEKCKMQSYADLRRSFYGPVTVQLEQQLKGTFAEHQYAVRLAFPKKAGEVPKAVIRFAEIKAAFWAVIDAVLEKIGKTRADLPTSFNAEQMLAFAVEQGLSSADIAEASAEIMRISLDLLHNGRNWDELFGKIE